MVAHGISGEPGTAGSPADWEKALLAVQSHILTENGNDLSDYDLDDPDEMGRESEADMISTRFIPHEKALDFIGPTKGNPDLAGWYWTSAADPKLDPQGPFQTQEEAMREGSKQETEEGPDFTVANHGSIFMVRPVTQAAKDWVEEHMELEGWQWLGNAFAVEHRYIDNLVAGIQGDGLTVA